jgi:homoserine dehydrogenase
MSSSTTRIVEIVQFGVGGVGQALLNLITRHNAALRARTGFDIRYRALVDSRSVMHLDENSALSTQHMGHVLAGLNAGEKLGAQPGAVQKPSDLAVLATELDRLKGQTGLRRTLVIVDVSGAHHEIMTPVITAALRNGQRAVLANKRPLCAPIADYKQMLAAAGTGASRLRYETTVGAALPVISTLQSLLDAQDSVRQINGTFSGTLGYLTSRLEEGASYSEAVREAKEKGYTEPDPRDDLGGVDVARKALILSRMLGSELELSDVEIEPLYPATLAELSVAEFMNRTPELDTEYGQKVANARADNAALRYLATVGDGKCKVGLEKVGSDTPFGRLRGTNNLIVFRTARYDANPLQVQGPGAGAELTASGVLADIIAVARN